MNNNLVQLKNGQAVENGVKVAKKTYLVGTAYANGIPTITSGEAGFVLNRGVLVPYQTVDGTWWLEGNIDTDITSSNGWIFSISGVTFKSGGNGQTGSLYSNGALAHRLSFLPGTSNVNPEVSSAGSAFLIAFRVQLDDKPLWAD